LKFKKDPLKGGRDEGREKNRPLPYFLTKNRGRTNTGRRQTGRLYGGVGKGQSATKAIFMKERESCRYQASHGRRYNKIGGTSGGCWP